jgi:hypothetical protein
MGYAGYSHGNRQDIVMGIGRIQSWEYAGYSHGNMQDTVMGIGRI